ncbi:MAG TPA: Fe-S cluster assembly protein SufD [Woeseiaceae bacterium]|nr:Fe-S cluster assembly protein SufD [Woeseiaceae bacterium]
MKRTAIDTGLLEEVVGGLPRDAFTASREAALARFRERGFPTTREEDWKYTNLAPVVEVSNRWLRQAAAGELPPPALSPAGRERAEAVMRGIDAHWIVIGNGIVERDSLAPLAGLPGVAAAASPAAPEPALAGSALPAGDALSLFNTALLREALAIRLAPGTVLEKPLGLLVVDDAPHGQSLSLPRITVEAGANARASVVEVHVSAGAHEQFANALVDVVVAAGGALRWLRLQQRALGHYQVGRLRVRLARDASFEHAGIDLGGGLVRNDVAVEIGEPGAAVSLHGLYLAGGRQHVDNHTRVDHLVGPARSTEEYRGILTDRARGVFNGKAVVHPGADGTDARQANHNLLLSAEAEVDTKPELEIYADEVKCSHGATVGQLDENALFYLRTRGLSHHEAVQALTLAFARVVVSHCPVAEACAHLERAVEARLEELAVAVPAERVPDGSATAGARP